MLKLNTYNQSINCVCECVFVSECVYILYIFIFVSLLLFWLLAVCSEFLDILVEYNLKHFSFCFLCFFYNLNFCFVNSDRLLKYVLFIYIKCVNLCFKEVIIRVCCVCISFLEN